jgi:hypothetical protein
MQVSDFKAGDMVVHGRLGRGRVEGINTEGKLLIAFDAKDEGGPNTRGEFGPTWFSIFPHSLWIEQVDIGRVGAENIPSKSPILERITSKLGL